MKICIGAILVFGVMFYPLRQPEASPGDASRVCGSHDCRSRHIWAEVPEVQ